MRTRVIGGVGYDGVVVPAAIVRVDAVDIHFHSGSTVIPESEAHRPGAAAYLHSGEAGHTILETEDSAQRGVSSVDGDLGDCRFLMKCLVLGFPSSTYFS